MAAKSGTGIARLTGRSARPCKFADRGTTLLILSLLATLLALPLARSFAVAAEPSPGGSSGKSDQFAQQRREMVELQLKARDIDDQAVLRAMAAVPRHLFVPDRLHSQAYIDFPLPIGYGQTISQPYIVAYMTQAIRPEPHHRVLEIGTGSGYQAAILAELVERVYTMEIVPELAASADKRLRELGYAKVVAREGDGYQGWPDAAPFDAIVVTAAAEFIPPPLLQQLKDGGRMVIPVGSPFHVQHLTLVEKKEGRLTTRILLPVRFVPLRRAK
ncbi:MAG: protein-L-isoaspartate(D-aspartate) O-methyltransferase [Desulfobulbaceae bacterium]